jgi:predicted nuclease with TOPRIM domain
MDDTMKELKGKVAVLETKVDMLESELTYLNEMLMRCGFSEGIHTLKETVEELLSEQASTQGEERESI